MTIGLLINVQCLTAGTSRQCEQVPTAAAWKPEEKKLKVKDGVERAECSLGKSAIE